MAIFYDDGYITFTSVVYENEIVELRNFLQQKAPQKLLFDFTECDDVHLGVLQLLMAYKKVYECDFEVGVHSKAYIKVLQGFDTSENYCNK